MPAASRLGLVRVCLGMAEAGRAALLLAVEG